VTDRPDEELSPEAQALRRIASVLETEQTRQRSGMNSVMQQFGIYTDPKEAREKERADREREQAKLYRLVVLIAAISAFASIVSVVVAVLSA
jgi:disulfide oxidoreductase YuzD